MRSFGCLVISGDTVWWERWEEKAWHAPPSWWALLVDRNTPARLSRPPPPGDKRKSEKNENERHKSDTKRCFIYRLCCLLLWNTISSMNIYSSAPLMLRNYLYHHNNTGFEGRVICSTYYEFISSHRERFNCSGCSWCSCRIHSMFL